MARVTRRPQAEQDLIDIWLYIARDNARAAEQVLDAVDAAASLLAECPELGVVLEVGAPELAGIRFHTLRRYRNYVIYYMPLSDGIEIIRVLERHRNRRDLLKPG